MAHVLLATAYCALRGDVVMAEAEVCKAFEINPQDKWAYLHMGYVYRRVGLYEEAAEAYRQALQIDPKFELERGRQQVVCEGGGQ